MGALMTAFVKWPPQQSSDWASWVQAAGVIVGIAIAICVPYQQDRKRDKQRRQGPLITLRPIIDRAII